MSPEGWVKKEIRARSIEDRQGHAGALVARSPYLTIRRLYFDLVPPPDGQARYFLVTFHKPVKIDKVRARIVNAFDKNGGE